MDNKIRECYEGYIPTKHILPFFWQHGEDFSVLSEEITAIQNSGINEFCVESRIHEMFCEEKWWEDFGFLLKEAQKRNMKVWLLDDKRFPSGYANNYIESHPELRAVRLRMEFRDFLGPFKDAALLPIALEEDEEFISIVAYRRNRKGDFLIGEGVPLLTKMKDGLIWWDIPEGEWRVSYIIKTKKTKFKDKINYIDVMSEDSCKAMIYAIYEPHYEHFKEYFGSTFKGFFSDEPGFSNEKGHYNSTLGREDMYIPWNDEVITALEKKTEISRDKILRLLPALWHEIDGYTVEIREAYMEVATETYSKNVSWLLGNWCREHNVMYIGHIIEDQNAHQRLGYGAGHFFRALEGQDMSGCDVVLHQVIPGFTEFEHSASLEGRRADPEFFNYTLPKLASSQGHIQAIKKGRSMCEIFGAFGWGEGIPEMKYLADLMLVSGINYFVPHAFSPKRDDSDCPPHFYAGGKNIQYPVFRDLMIYMQRMCHILSDGVHQAHVAVYYNAEAEWSGGRQMLPQEICKRLVSHQIDFDLIPQDVICEGTYVKDGRLVIQEETYGALIVPYSQYLPERVMLAFQKLALEGAQVLFLDGYPDFLSNGQFVENIVHQFKVVSIDELYKELCEYHLNGMSSEKECETLRFFHVKRGNYDVYMFWNESTNLGVDTEINLVSRDSNNSDDVYKQNGHSTRRAIFYDAWNNKLYETSCYGNRVRVRLAPSESIILCIGESQDNLPSYNYFDGKRNVLNLEWTVSIKEPYELEFKPYPLTGLINIAHKLPYFSGVVRYESIWNVQEENNFSILEFEHIGEVAQLWINEIYCGSVVSKPYRFNVTNKLKKGRNIVRIEVMSNLAYRERDSLSTFIPLPPTGLIEPVKAT